jgi:hypothetical protein
LDYSNEFARHTAPAFRATIFHEPWWLDAVTQGDWCEARVNANGKMVARLPYVMKRSMGITALGMPPLTHTLGPQLSLFETAPGFHKPDHRALLNELMGQLPRHDYFHQVCDPSIENTLPLYTLGYDSALTYTLRIEASQSTDITWQGIRPRIRQTIQKAQKTFALQYDLGIDEFCHFYNLNVKSNHKLSWSKNFERRANQVKIRLYEACRAQDSGCLLAVRDEKNVLRAAIMLVWGHGVMFYFLTVHDADPAGAGAIKLLIWEALKMAHAKRLTFDFDGFSRPEAVNILTGFGGDIRNRIAITKISPFLLFARTIKSKTRFAF